MGERPETTRARLDPDASVTERWSGGSGWERWKVFLFIFFGWQAVSED